MAEHSHHGHRERMRARFLDAESGSLQPQELLELLLFYGIPRVDTAPVAHELMETFGSLHGVISASPEALRRVRGMTEPAAVLIALLRRMYEYDAAECSLGVKMESFAGMCNYFSALYRFAAEETVRAAFLDDRLRLLGCEIIAEGQPERTPAFVRRIAEAAYSFGSRVVVLAHNHPQGCAGPLPADIAAARHLTEMLKAQGIFLVDYIIAGTDRTVSLREAGAFLGLEIS